MTALTALLLSTLLLAMARSSAAQGRSCSVCTAGYAPYSALGPGFRALPAWPTLDMRDTIMQALGLWEFQRNWETHDTRCSRDPLYGGTAITGNTSGPLFYLRSSFAILALRSRCSRSCARQGGEHAHAW